MINEDDKLHMPIRLSHYITENISQNIIQEAPTSQSLATYFKTRIPVPRHRISD